MTSCCNHFRVFFISLGLSSHSGIFLYFHVACDVSFDWQLKARKSDTVTGSNELFTAGCRSRRLMASCCNHFRESFISLGLSSQSGIFLYFRVASDVSFDWQLKARKSDTVPGTNELFTAGCRSRRLMASCCNHFCVFFISLGFSSQSGIFLYFRVACDVSFDWNLKALESDTVPGSNELFTTGCRSHRLMASWCNHFRVSYISLGLSSKIWIFFIFLRSLRR
jgi:hypothetical protein